MPPRIRHGFGDVVEDEVDDVVDEPGDVVVVDEGARDVVVEDDDGDTVVGAIVVTGVVVAGPGVVVEEFTIDAPNRPASRASHVARVR